MGYFVVIDKIVIQNYRFFRNFTLHLTPGMNILVGDNGTGKSSLLEAVNLALTSRLYGHVLAQELSPYLFNMEITSEYLAGVAKGIGPEPPELLIELFLNDTADTSILRGTNNSLGEDACGIRYRASFNSDYSKEYSLFIEKPEHVRLIPTEYYKVEWLGFSGNAVTPRSIPATASLIDASSIRLQSGTDHYMQGIINSHLDASERVELARAYRSLREEFANNTSIKAINTKLATTDSDVSDRSLSLGIDISQKASWESNLVPHLDDLPFQYVGKGEQSTLKILLALNRKIDDAHIILVEEPENHLSFSSLNMLVSKIGTKCADKQVLIATHSSYVLNKLGLENLILLSPAGGLRITNLAEGTQDYFQKLSGYDTLRLILAKQVILVEGPSDELIVQRAYLDKNGKLPIEDGVDVINVRGLSFKRFLDIAVPLGLAVRVVTDNDGNDPNAVVARYSEYEKQPNISVHVGQDASGPTMEPQLVTANNRTILNQVFGKTFNDDQSLLEYMCNNKTTCALAIFEWTNNLTMPSYIDDAVTK